MTARNEHGAAAVEFALLVPVLLLIVFGIIDFSRAYNAHIALSGGARVGARELALETGDHVQATIDAAPSLSGITVTTPQTCDSSDSAELHANYEFAFITPLSAFMQWFGGGGVSGITITGIGVMRCGG